MNLVGVTITRHALERYQELQGQPPRHSAFPIRNGEPRPDLGLISALASARRVKLLQSTRAVRNFIKYSQGADYFVNSGLWFVVSAGRPRAVLTVYRADNLKRGKHWDFDGDPHGR